MVIILAECEEYSCVCRQCICLTKFLQVFFSFHMQKINAQKINARQLTRTFKKVTCIMTCEGENHTSIDTLEIELTHITRQLEYYKL